MEVRGYNISGRLMVIVLSLGMVMLLLVSGCKEYDNFTTYFNTFYNAERLMRETEEDFDYQEEKVRVKPRVVVPENKLFVPGMPQKGPPPFMSELIINQQKLQPVRMKLDSIIIKGSKILARHPKSNYIEGTLYLMAKAFFYENEWINSEIKCSELIDKYGDGELSPDCHLLMAEDYLIERKFYAGELLLSRTVDVAWEKKRYDILSEAFRLEAELSMYLNDPEGALKPYKQAILESEDDEMRAKWQCDMASLLYRMGKFERAEKMFEKVREFDPDYLGIFESYLYQAGCLSRTGKYKEAEVILDRLEGDGKYQEWRANIMAERLNILRLKKKDGIVSDSLFQKATMYADSVYVNNDAIATVYYEAGMDNFDARRYTIARNYFARSKIIRTPVLKSADMMYKLLNAWESKRNVTVPLLQRLAMKDTLNDSTNTVFAVNLFELGRIHEQLGNADSAEFYYKTAMDISPAKNKETARYIYAYARFIEDKNPPMSDSLMDNVVAKYPTTEYGIDARKRLGYTEEFVIDTVGELYKSGVSLRENKEFQYALVQFNTIYDKYPKSPYAPKALYALGWTYENNLNNRDSAYYYYLLLLKKYPNSEYARDISILIDYSNAVKSGKVPDSLKDKSLIKYEPKSDKDTLSSTIPTKGQKNKSIFNDPLDIMNHPKDLLKSITDPIENTKQTIENTKETITDPSKMEDKLTPGIKIENPFKDLMQDSTKSKKDEPPK